MSELTFNKCCSPTRTESYKNTKHAPVCNTTSRFYQFFRFYISKLKIHNVLHKNYASRDAPFIKWNSWPRYSTRTRIGSSVFEISALFSPSHRFIVASFSLKYNNKATDLHNSTLNSPLVGINHNISVLLFMVIDAEYFCVLFQYLSIIR